MIDSERGGQIDPVGRQERIEILDVLRGLAVCGILVGNMQWFSGYGFMPLALGHQSPMVDQVTHFLVHFLVEGKFYSIFSFLFGFGFAIQIAKADERGDTNAALFKRRLFWLLVIGLLHALFLWSGDILSVYAVMGFLLLLFRKKTNGSLLKWTFVLLVIPILTYLGLYGLFVAFAPPEAAAMVNAGQTDMWNQSITSVPQSSYFQILTGYNVNMLIGRYAGLIFQMRLPKILAMFLLGVYAYRRGFFQNASSHQLFTRSVLIYGLSFGLIANVLFGVLSRSEADFPPTPAGLAGVIAYSFGVPALALGIIALVTTMWQKTAWQRLFRFLAPVGRMALTNYLLQTVICVIIFYGFGFGRYGSVGANGATLIALSIFLFQIVISVFWLKYFNYGPVEWIWRQLTYRKRLRLIK